MVLLNGLVRALEILAAGVHESTGRLHFPLEPVGGQAAQLELEKLLYGAKR